MTAIISKEEAEKLPYRPCVGICLFNQDGKVFVGERLDNPGAWQMPQGGIDEGETVEQALWRELQEEVGTQKADLIRIADQTICYDLPLERVLTFWNGRYRGQEQTWVALKFTGQDSDININIFDEPEFSRWQWVSLKDTPDMIVPFKRETYRQVIELFSDIAG